MSAVSSRIRPPWLRWASRPGYMIKLDCPVPYFRETGLSSTMLAMAQTRPAAGTQARHDGETRTARKRRAILGAATTLFLRDGYQATSMDQIAAAAAVSKQTVYKQFADKQSLFREIVADTVAEVADPVA